MDKIEKVFFFFFIFFLHYIALKAVAKARATFRATTDWGSPEKMNKIK